MLLKLVAPQNSFNMRPITTGISFGHLLKLFLISIAIFAITLSKSNAQLANLNGCSNYTPAAGETVTCNNTFPSNANGVQAAVGNNNVTVNISANSQRSINGSTVGLGSGSTVTNAGYLNTLSFFNGYGISFGANGRSKLGGNTVTNTATGSIYTAGGNATAIYVWADDAAATSNTVTNNGILSTTGSNAYGIRIRSRSAAATIDNTGNITTSGDSSHGIFTENNGGLATINNGANGSINVSGANSSAIYVRKNPDYAGNASVSITNSGILRSQAVDINTAVISLGGVTATTIQNLAGGDINSNGAIYGPSGLAIASRTPASDGAFTINNSGLITGRVETTNNTDSFTNSGAWNTSSDNKFYIGADTITNSVGGVINTYGNTNFDMGGQAPVFENTVTNNGMLKINNGPGGSAGILNIFSTGNEILKFVNSGTIDLSNSGVGKPTNQLIINGNVYTEPGSNIIIDVPQGNSSSNIVVEGDVSGGKTGIQINPETVGSNNPIGTAVVSIHGNDTSGGFAISPTSPNFYFNNGTALVNAGLYYEYLGRSTGGPSCANGYTCYSIYSIASAAARTLPIAVTAAQSLWQETSLMWEDRQVELRDSTHAHASVSNNDMTCDDPRNRSGCGISTWLKSVGSWSNRSNNQTHFGGNGAAFSYDLGYRQNMFGMLGGADWSKIGLFSQRDFFAVGIMGGYLQSNVGFNQEAGNMFGSSNFSYQGGTLGGSVTYMNNGLFAEALFKTDLLGLNMTLPIGSLRNAAIGVRTAGGVGNLGYRYDYGSMFVEPLATLTYSTTGMGSINSLIYQNVGIGFGSGRDFRGGFGGRLGTSWSNIFSSHVFEASLTGRYWNMFNSNAGRTVDIMSSGVGETIGDYTLGRDYGEVKGNLNLFSVCSGWSAFANTGVKWNNQFTTVTTKGGIAYRW